MNNNREELEKLLFRRISRLLIEYEEKAPEIIIKQELILVSEACIELSKLLEKNKD